MTHISSANYWSSVVRSASIAWDCNDNGMSNNNYFTNTWLRGRAVTKSETKEILMEIEELYKAYRISRKHNRRSRDMSVFEMGIYGRLLALCNAVNSRTYSPSANYAFIHYRPKAREVFAAEPELKVLMVYLDMRVNPLIDAKLSDRVFNNRVGKGTHAAINRVVEDICECSEGYTKDCWIIKGDYRGYFPNMRQDVAYGIFEKVILNDYAGSDKDELLYLARTICFCNPQENAEKRSQLSEWSVIPPYKSLFRKPFGTGGAIGFTFWQVASNAYPCEVDAWILGHITPHYVRYVDDMVFVTDNKECTLVMMKELRERLAAVGIELHPNKFYCQHWTKGLELLGYHVRRGGIHVNRKIQERAMRRAKRRHDPHYIEAMNSYLGILKSGSDRNALEALMKQIPDTYEKDCVCWKIREKEDKRRKGRRRITTSKSIDKEKGLHLTAESFV